MCWPFASVEVHPSRTLYYKVPGAKPPSPKPKTVRIPTYVPLTFAAPVKQPAKSAKKPAATMAPKKKFPSDWNSHYTLPDPPKYNNHAPPPPPPGVPPFGFAPFPPGDGSWPASPFPLPPWMSPPAPPKAKAKKESKDKQPNLWGAAPPFGFAFPPPPPAAKAKKEANFWTDEPSKESTKAKKAPAKSAPDLWSGGIPFPVFPQQPAKAKKSSPKPTNFWGSDGVCEFPVPDAPKYPPPPPAAATVKKKAVPGGGTILVADVAGLRRKSSQNPPVNTARRPTEGPAASVHRARPPPPLSPTNFPPASDNGSYGIVDAAEGEEPIASGALLRRPRQATARTEREEAMANWLRTRAQSPGSVTAETQKATDKTKKRAPPPKKVNFTPSTKAASASKSAPASTSFWDTPSERDEDRSDPAPDDKSIANPLKVLVEDINPGENQEVETNNNLLFEIPILLVANERRRPDSPCRATDLETIEEEEEEEDESDVYVQKS